MKTKVKKAESITNRQINEGRGLDTASRIFIYTIGTTILLLLFPSVSKLSVFSKGEFAYLESIGIIFTYLILFSVFLYFLSKIFLKTSIKNGLVRYVIFIGTVGGSVFFMIMVIIATWIRFDVKTNCEVAKKEYGGSCVEALSSQLDDTNQGFRSRNSAIWALGQLADRDSLPILNKYYTGKIPKREPLNKTISQYELKKAIRWCENGNITSWMYKGL